MTTLAIVVARLNSSRLSRKHFLPLPSDANGGTMMLIDHLINRLNKCSEIDDIALATTTDRLNHPLIDWADKKKLGVLAFDGHADDVVSRLDALINYRKPKFIVYISGDCPLIDPIFIDCALHQLKKTNFETVSLVDGIKSLHEGIGFYSYSGWKKLAQQSKSKLEREHIGYSNIRKKYLKTLKIHDVYDFSKITHRISVDTQADYHFMFELYSRWFSQNPKQSIVDLRWVQEQIINDEKLRAINKHVVQRKATKAYSVINFYCHVGKEIGLGHLKRCELIAEKLTEELGVGAYLNVCNTSDFDLEVSVPVRWYNCHSSLELATRNDTGDLIILDFNLKHFTDYQKYFNTLQSLKYNKKKIIGIDSLHEFIDVLDKLFVPSFYNEHTSDKIISGWDTYLFSNRAPQNKSKTILVLTGGSDAQGYGTSLTKALDAHNTSYEIIWIQGPLADKPILKENSRIEVIYHPKNLKDLIERSEIVISAYGISFFEALFRDCATILLPPNGLFDKTEILQLKREHCCIVAESEKDVISHLSLLERDRSLKHVLVANNQNNFKNKTGLDKLARIVNDLLES